MSRRGPGRPPADDPRRPMAIRVTDAERDLLDAAATRAGESRSDYVRRVVLEQAEADLS